MTTRDKATGKSERLAVLNSAEQEALYGLPDFDDAQRLEFLALDESELALACSRQGLSAQIYCILQIAYFKAKHLFFRGTVAKFEFCEDWKTMTTICCGFPADITKCASDMFCGETLQQCQK